MSIRTADGLLTNLTTLRRVIGALVHASSPHPEQREVDLTAGTEFAKFLDAACATQFPTLTNGVKLFVLLVASEALLIDALKHNAAAETAPATADQETIQ